MFTPVQVHIEGLPWIVAGALLHQITKADEVDSVDGASRLFEFFNAGGQIVKGAADSLDSFRGATIWLPCLS